MTERQRDKVSEIASAIFNAMDHGFIVRDDAGNIVAGLRYGSRDNSTSWSYLYYNDKGHMVSKPVIYGEDKDSEACKRFTVDKGGKKPEILK